MTTPEYQAPPAAPPTQGPSGPRASFGRRLVAALIDGILLGIIGGILSIANKNLGYLDEHFERLLAAIRAPTFKRSLADAATA